VVIGGDGQVTQGQTIMKGNARKVRRLYRDQVIAGFAGGTADAFTLFERFEEQLEKHHGKLTRAAVELAKLWRSDRALRRLEALLLVADKDASLTNTPQQLNRMYFLSIPAFEYEVGEDWDWMDRDGSVLHLAVGNTSGYTGIVDAYEACMFAYLQLAVERSRANSVLTDLKES